MGSKQVSIIEVGPRDGLQSEPELLSTATKLDFIQRAVDAGVRRMEVTSFVHPKRVPQMADAEAVVCGLPKHDDVTYIGLVLNKRGFDRALAVQMDEIGMAVIASETYNQRNNGAAMQDSINAWLEMSAEARREGMRANVMVSSAFGCPFEGEVPLSRVLDIVSQVMEGDPVELGFADSIGVGVPAQVTEMIGAVREIAPKVPLRFHFHNTRNTGLANAQAAVEAGVDSLDASIGGIGGCPFAPAATGNIPTDDLLYMLSRQGVETGVSLDKIVETSHWLGEQLGRGTPAMLPKAGIFPQVAEQYEKAS
ncbi:MAG: hydroxymethylglutaryl-CoA lyase [Gammaproteobacteria bacterium]|nr:hydroxymethylglutaryl-CoA lyase [Gammaproteobacteria bacterium]MCP4090537.1 hydroxymethylglutaryl-CoA lyase [Gammaproteobacteria bacterium]MCP4276598.1 hydroxymethylglutaryl-CoA lyase [Gammaproteobacteria bacterium]MCP4831336.1 hydroxymethylglutaryl-CoA lyase [Gammaproteobacteria bacterium]MCP4928732.1 hydroxymethylglutaryl-CoA lyase [Gammaproteobacteria bacterium]